MIGVNIAIFQDNRLLLTQRDDFEVWCLPGGVVEPGETLAQAAAREAKEETGLDVRLTRLVGVYSRPGAGQFTGQVVLFAAQPAGGSLQTQTGETIDLRYFDIGKLPAERMTWMDLRIRHSLEGAGGSVAWFHNRQWPFKPGLARDDLYALRDQSGLAAAEFYRRYMSQPGPGGDLLEVPALVWPPAYPCSAPLYSADQATGMPEVGVNLAIIQDGKILLTRREDYHVWCLPGGGLEEGESLVQAARREAREETGLEVMVERLVGVYSEPRWFYRGLHVVVFMGHVIGGELDLQLEEVIEARFFGLDELPDEFLYGNRQRALDALAGIGGGVAWRQNLPWPFDPALDRRQIFQFRDRSGLSRSTFYQQYFKPPAAEDEVDELSA